MLQSRPLRLAPAASSTYCCCCCCCCAPLQSRKLGQTCNAKGDVHDVFGQHVVVRIDEDLPDRQAAAARERPFPARHTLGRCVHGVPRLDLHRALVCNGGGGRQGVGAELKAVLARAQPGRCAPAASAGVFRGRQLATGAGASVQDGRQSLVLGHAGRPNSPNTVPEAPSVGAARWKRPSHRSFSRLPLRRARNKPRMRQRQYTVSRDPPA